MFARCIKKPRGKDRQAGEKLLGSSHENEKQLTNLMKASVLELNNKAVDWEERNQKYAPSAANTNTTTRTNTRRRTSTITITRRKARRR